MNRKPIRSADIRERNEKLVLSLIHRYGSLSQSDVVQTTGLKAPTVFRIFSELEERECIIPDDPRKAALDRKGRRPAYYRINPVFMHVASLDFWAGSAAGMVSDFAGKPIVTREIYLPRSEDAEGVLGRIADLIDSLLRDSGMDRDRLLGIGIGAPGSINQETGAVTRYSRINGMIDFPLRERLESRFGIPVSVQNNCAVIGLSEYRYEIPKTVSSMLTVLVRSGVGGSFIHDGRIFSNNHSTGMELGRIPVYGNQTLETFLSEDAIFKETESMGISGIPALEQALANGHESVNRILAERSEVFSVAIKGVCELLTPEILLVVSRSKILSDFLGNSLRSVMEADDAGERSRVTVRTAQYSPEHSLRGASDLVFDRYFA